LFFFKRASDFLNDGNFVIDPFDEMDSPDDLNDRGVEVSNKMMAEGVLEHKVMMAMNTIGVRNPTPGAATDSKSDLTSDESKLRTLRLERWRAKLEQEKNEIKERNELAKKVAAEKIPDPTTFEEEEEESTEMTDPEWAGLLQDWKLFREQVAVDGEQYEWINFDKIPRYCQEVIRSMHNARKGHLGVGRTIDMIRLRRLTFSNYIKIVEKYIRHCMVCQTMRSSKLMMNAYDPQLCTDPWRVVFMDHITKLPKTSRGNTAILVMIDAATHYALLFAVPSLSEEDVVYALCSPS
jgi:hypothetical protein